MSRDGYAPSITDFVLGLLTIDPDERPLAGEVVHRSRVAMAKASRWREQNAPAQAPPGMLHVPSGTMASVPSGADGINSPLSGLPSPRSGLSAMGNSPMNSPKPTAAIPAGLPSNLNTPPTVLSAPPTNGGSGDLLVVTKEPDAPLGLTWDSMILRSVQPGSAGARAGAGAYIGRRLTHVAGAAVQSLGGIRASARGRSQVELRFTPVGGGGRGAGPFLQSPRALPCGAGGAPPPASLGHPPKPLTASVQPFRAKQMTPSSTAPSPGAAYNDVAFAD